MRKQAERWFFGDKAGIDFRTGSALPDTSQNVMMAIKASSVASDSAGNLLFLTNGKTIWDRYFMKMSGATDLAGDLGVTQPCVIVPAPDDPAVFYIFTIDVLAYKPDNTFTTDGMRYSTVDMRRNNGLGEVVTLNRPLLNPACQKLTAIMHKDGRSVWVLAHAWDSDRFYAYKVTDGGIRDSVISNTGSTHTGGYAGQTNAEGAMKVSPDGKFLALAITGLDKVELFSFNTETGSVGFLDSRSMGIQGLNAYGIEFSPDSRKLYTTLLQRGGNGPPSRPSYIYQFDLSGKLQNPVLLDSVAGLRIGFLQVAPDGRIYGSRTASHLIRRDSVDVIYNPNRPGIACNYNRLNNQPNALFSLNGRSSIFSLPNFIQTYFDLPAFTWDSVCHGEATRFRITNKANIDSVRWDFGDGGTSNQIDPVHFYAQPGLYTVRLTEIFKGESFTDSAQVRSYNLPVIALPDTVLLYSGSSIVLHAGGGSMEYLWNNGSTDSLITVESQGKYSVSVRDFNCCTNTDSTYVKVFEYRVPSAFTPNNDGLNDVFRVIGNYTNISFEMTVFDRWGRLVFKSDNIDNGWNGMIGGSYCNPDTYVWIVNINFLSEDIVTQGDIVLKGTVTLVR
jgi:gliding motility-associated-like protein